MIYFNKDRIYVTGAYGAAIYDLTNRAVYEINHAGKLILDHVDRQDDYVFSENEQAYLNTLWEMQLLTTEKVTHTPYQNPKNAIKYVWLELTDACNLRCVHCYGDFGYCVTKHEDAMTKEEWQRVIKSVSAYPDVGIQLIGGEPLMCPDFKELLLYAHECGIKRIDIFTNATRLTDEIIDLIARCHASVRISIYGHNSAVHDGITKKKGSFDQLITGLQKLTERKIKVKLALIIMKENEAYIEDIIHFLKQLPIPYNGYDVIRNTTPGKKNEHYVHDARILRQRYQYEPKFTTSYEEFYHNKQYNSCWNGKFSVTANGDVIPCIFARQSVCGNVKTEPLPEIISNLEREWSITKDKVKTCCDCEYRYACHDCRPTAYGITGDYLSKHERCTYDPYTGVWATVADYTHELNED